MVLALLAHLVIKLRKPRTPKVFQKFFSAVGNRNKDHDSCINHKLIITAVVCSLVFSHLIGIFQVFLGVIENRYIVGSLLCFGMGIVRCPFNLLYYMYVIW